MMEYNALYVQLMNSIKEKMIRGEYQVGDKLDSERIMAQQYGINRMTVRKAINGLKEQGFLMAERGSGTFVIKVPQQPARIEQGKNQSSISLSMQIRQSGYESSRTVISFRKISAEGELSARFQGVKELLEMVRLSRVNGEPYAVQKTYIPADIFWNAERYDFAGGSLYEYMDTLGRMPKKIETSFQIGYAPQKYAALLNLKLHKKVFCFVYMGYDKDNVLVEYTDSYYLPEYTSFTYIVNKGRR